MNNSESLLSQDWYRVAFMRPRLRAGVRVSRQSVRGDTWYVLSDPVSGRHHRFNDVAYALIASCDGQRTLDEVWAARVATEGDDAPTQGQAIGVFSQAFAANLFVGDVAPDAAAIVSAQARTRASRARAAVNPLAFRLPLWDPDRFLSRHIDKLRWIFTAAALRVAWCVVLLGALLLALNADAVAGFALHELGSPRIWLVLWLIYPPLKFLHELAHAFTVKAHGGDVHEMGVTLLLLTPVPYVDASASVAFEGKRERIAVAGAGIMVETLLASAALVFWLLLEPGLPKDIAFAIVFIGALSTLVVNGNPLLRFDGYHVLCDALELPNLAPRSARYWLYLIKRYGLRLSRLRFAGRARGELPWLLAYAPLAWCYRVALTAFLATTLASFSAPFGLAMLALGAWMFLGKPAFAALRWAAASSEASGQRLRAATLTLAGVAFAGTLAFGIQVPHRSHAPGVVWLPDDAIVRLGVDGFVEQFLARDGDAVEPGTPIALLANEPLQLELAGVEAQLDRQQVERAARYDNDALRTALAEDEMARLAAERDRLRERVDRLTVRAAIAGRVVIDPQRSVVGQYLVQGHLLAHVLPDGAPLVRALVRNEDIALVRERPGTIEVTLAHAGGAKLRGVFDGAVPQATTTLPTPALGEAAGGSIAIADGDKSGRTAREARFQLDLRLDAATDARIGARALVTFLHGEASVAELLGRFTRQSFLRHFER